MTYLLVYVDDMLLVTPNEEIYNDVIRRLGSEFVLTELGDVKHFLGIQVIQTEHGYNLCQKSYIEKLAVRFGLADAKGSKIPMDPGYIQQKEDSERLPTNDKYQSLIGGLLYLAVNTRPDIAISASILGRSVSQPVEQDWTEAKRVLRYLKATINHQLRLGNGTQTLEAYADADWAGNVKDRKSNSGYLFRLGGGTIAWCARKQTCVALSSIEAEYISLAECCQELIWFRKLLQDFGDAVKTPIQIYEDNQSCIKMLTSNGEKRSKHIDEVSFCKEFG
ncbi:uncharacterized protein LOC129766578 [Toxorhynchites rutilus septentrionalis]|uniref:uncharacterized protein LOC129766578 n=1 Tax=Toxorhynchites rutilus septentrionalis TaxID=329112 RepID=UPI002479FEBA|nr:uncharacterized protein LOC129766578 [Toxorhynchites rutilus septentrionalis]